MEATPINAKKIEIPPQTGVGATCKRLDEERDNPGNREDRCRIAKVRQVPSAKEESRIIKADNE